MRTEVQITCCKKRFKQGRLLHCSRNQGVGSRHDPNEGQMKSHMKTHYFTIQIEIKLEVFASISSCSHRSSFPNFLPNNLSTCFVPKFQETLPKKLPAKPAREESQPGKQAEKFHIFTLSSFLQTESPASSLALQKAFWRGLFSLSTTIPKRPSRCYPSSYKIPSAPYIPFSSILIPKNQFLKPSKF